MEVIIRYAQIDDLAKIVEIYNQAISTKSVTGDIKQIKKEDKEDWFYEHNQNDFPILVAEYDKNVVGWICISPYRKGREGLKKTVEVSYYIDYQYQKIQIGSKLLNEMLTVSKKLGYNNIFAILFDINIGSVKLLEKYDFQKWGLLPDVIEIDGVNYSHLYYGRKL